MSIRIIALYAFVIFFAVYAWKDWFKSLCALILLMAVIEHEDMPKNIFGIQGLNLWNMLFVGISLAWLASHRREGLTWDMPRHVSVLLLIYLGVILFGVLRALLDRSYIQDYPLKSLISEELINTIKWVLPAVLLFDGCRTRRRVIMAIVCLLLVYLLISVQVIRRLPPSSVFNTGGEIDQTRKACEDIGYTACDLSTFLAGAFWAIIAATQLVRRKKYKLFVLAAALMVMYGQALTGGRAGYLAWGSVGLIMCIMRWHKYLILAPVVLILLPVIFPGAASRMFEGFGEIDVAGQATINQNAVTSDRKLFWPYIVAKIEQSPLIGYGRLAMRRTGLVEYIETEHPGIGASQPHNMYLETLLDNGIVGSLPIFLFWAMMVVYSAVLFRSPNHLFAAVGGLSLSLMLAQIFSGIGSQHVYPEESTFGMWTAIFLTLRVHVEEKKARVETAQAEAVWRAPVYVRQKNAVSVQTNWATS